MHDRRLEISWTQKSVTYLMVFVKDSRGRYRSDQSITSGGTTYIRNGRFEGGGEVPWFTKCNNSPS